MTRTWFITGSSRGLGRHWAEAALERGDNVAATARRPESLQQLVDGFGGSVLPLKLDVTDRRTAVAAVGAAVEHFGRLDIVVNNAGYGHFGMVEELSEADVRAQMETNFFGALWVTQAALPIMREQRAGHILQVSSLGGVTAFPNIGAYHASKWALEGLTQSLAQEVRGLGIRVTLVEPAGYSTDWLPTSSSRSEENPAYANVRDQQRGTWASAPGDPKATRAAILSVVDSHDPPLRVFFGDSALHIVSEDYESRLSTWRQWQPLSVEAHGQARATSD